MVLFQIPQFNIIESLIFLALSGLGEEWKAMDLVLGYLSLDHLNGSSVRTKRRERERESEREGGGGEPSNLISETSN